MSSLPDWALALAGAVVAEAWLVLLALPALRAAGDASGLPPAAYLLPVAAALVPWVLPARTRRTRGGQALLGQCACVAGAGLMVLSVPAGIAVAVAGIAAAALARG